MRKIFVLLFLAAGVVVSCNNSSETPAVAAVDSATKAAPDTLRTSMDTTSKVVDTLSKTVDTAAKKPL